MNKYIVFPLFLFILYVDVYSQSLLSGRYSNQQLSEILIDRDKWFPFPKITDREGWSKADQIMLQAIFNEANDLISIKWEQFPATTALLFERTGNRTKYEELFFKKRITLGTLLLAEVYENEGRFVDQIIDGVWSICEESYWGLPAHLNQWQDDAGLPDVLNPYVDLFSAETVALLSWVDYLIGEKLDTVSPQIRKRIYYESNKRIFDPVMNYEHPWMGFNETGRRPNNWNPWICSNWLCAALLLEKNSTRRMEMVARVLNVVDQFLDPYPSDGGCDEGPNYWNASGAALFDNVALLNLATNNAFDFVFADEKVKNMAKYIYRAQIGTSYFLNFADAIPQPNIDACTAWRFGKAINDEQMQNFAAWFRKEPDGKIGSTKFTRILYELFQRDEFNEALKALPLPEEAWLPDLQIMVAREKEGFTDGFCIGAKGGNNNESHNHNDVGNFVVYYNEMPLLIDVGGGTYTARTFSNERYSLWFNRSDYHNLPSINNQTQMAGPEYMATGVTFSSDSQFACLSMNIAGCYPVEAGILNWNRSVKLNRGKNVEVTENIDMQKASYFLESFMTCHPVKLREPGTLVIVSKSDGQANDFILKYDPSDFSVNIEKMESKYVEDEKIFKNWNNVIYRINLSSVDKVKKGKFVFSILSR